MAVDQRGRLEQLERTVEEAIGWGRHRGRRYTSAPQVPVVHPDAMVDEIDGPRLRRVPTEALTSVELRSIRALMDAAFGTGDEAFGDDDWAHALGGLHLVLELDGEIVSHASVVERLLEIGGRPVRTGYVEAVATGPEAQGRGHGTLVMEAAAEHVRSTFELGALGTGRHAFYERLGWQTWRGPAFVRTPKDCSGRPTTRASSSSSGHRPRHRSTSASRSAASGARATSGSAGRWATLRA